jgi:hypothetical protein
MNSMGKRNAGNASRDRTNMGFNTTTNAVVSSQNPGIFNRPQSANQKRKEFPNQDR